MAHRRQGSRAARRQGDPSFIFEDFTGDPKGPGHPGASAGPGGKSKIPGPVKDHRGKSRGPKSKGKNSRDRAQGGGNAEAKAESPEGRGSPGGQRSAAPAPRAEEASPASRPLTNGVNSDRKPVSLSEPQNHAVERELKSITEPLEESGTDTKKSSSETNGKEVNSVATPLIDNSESPEEPETVSIEPSSSVFETVEEPADEKGLHNSGLLNKSEHISETDIKTSKVNDMEPKQSDDDRGESSVLSKAENSPAEPKILKEAEVDNSETFRHIEINYMDPVQQLQTIVEETRDPEATGAESQKEQEDNESKESSETEEGAGKTMGEDSGQAHPQSARERKTKIPGLLKEPNSKGSGNKGLRVTFDLSNTQEKDENVIDSWEDLSDADGGDLVIDEDDIIDCGVKLSTMDDLLDLGEGLDVESPLTSPESGKPNESIQWFRPSDEFRSEPLDGKASNKAGDGSGDDKAIPGVDDVRPGASGAKDDEKNSGDNTPILGADIIPLSISVYNEANNSVEIPFIDGEEETCVDDDDDEWETEPSGGSSENGNSDKVLNVECRKEAPDKVSEGDDERNSQREEKEEQPGMREEEEDRTLVDQPSIEEDNSEKDDDLITKEDIDVVFMALEESPVKGETVPLATPEILSPIGMDASPPQKTQSRVFVGPLPRPEHTYAWDRPGSPQVSIGYECQERKAASVCSSETESDGELVPCEDKCIGTADFLVESDSEPLDLSSSSNDRTSSVCDTLSSQGQDAVEVRGVGKKASLAPDDDVHTKDANSEKDTLAVSDVQPDSSSPSSDGQEEANCVGKSESGKESQINGKKNGKKKGKKNKREVIAEPAPVPEHILGRPKLVRGRSWKEKRERFMKEYQDPLSLSFGKELCESEIVEDTSNLLTETCTEDSLEALPKSSSETALVMLPSRTDPLATAVNESSPSIAADVCAPNLPEVNIEDEALWISRNIVPPPPKVAIEVTAARGPFPVFSTSETESDGELVPCEDKCIGTADFLVESDSEPLDLSSSSNDRTSSVCDTLSSQGQDAVEVRGVGKKASLAPDDDVHTKDANSEKDTLAVSDVQPDSSSPSSDGQEEANCVGKSESGKEKTCTEDSLEALPKSSSETALVMLPSRTDPLATAVNESSPSIAADVCAPNLPEVNIEDEALWISRNIVPPPPKVAIEVTAASDEDESDFHSVHEKEDFYVVKAKETAKPLEAKTEYVGDSESSDEGPQRPHDQKAPEETSACEVWASSTPLIGISLDGSQLVKEKSHDMSESPIDSSDNSAYTDAKDSSCAESLPHSYDYVRSFPEVIGTQSLNLVYSYDTDSDFNSKPDQWSSRSKDTSLVVNGRGKNELEKAGPDVPAGEIVYEGPCSCRPGESRVGPLLPSYLAPTVGVGMSVGSQDSPLSVPSLFESDHDDVFSDDAMKLVVDSLVNEDSETLQDSAGDNDANGSDIRSRIKEIVGPRLQRERGRPTARGGRDEGDQGGDEHLLTSGESPRGGREESPLPGSSPASSSGVQGSDEMSLSRSRSRSPASKELASASVIPAPYPPDMIFEGCPLQPELTPDKMDPAESLRALRFESGLDSSPEKPQQVDCSFRTFRDMYQINPVYLTDSDDPEDPTESETIVQGPGGCDLDRSITVNNRLVISGIHILLCISFCPPH
ncbi:uncharacterized protein LOC134781044 [Penaeus indicus]|uniref:uncharacterized protein LOC134781044 n=1 Tax=Penaeus indicus TaxID=29960 RepID=UPI00300C6C82